MAMKSVRGPVNIYGCWEMLKRVSEDRRDITNSQILTLYDLCEASSHLSHSLWMLLLIFLNAISSPCVSDDRSPRKWMNVCILRFMVNKFVFIFASPFSLCPAVRQWHERIENEIYDTFDFRSKEDEQ